MEAFPETPQQVADLICDTLDPLMTEFGFQEGQGRVDVPAEASSVEIIYCVPSEIFHFRLPRLAPHLEWSDGECTDVTIEAQSSPNWKLTELVLEGYSMDSVLAGVASGLGAQVSAIGERPIREAVGRLEALLREAFEQTRSSRLDWRYR